MSTNVCIYFSDTGGGHRSAADAVEAGIRQLLDQSGERDVRIIKDNVAEKSHPLNQAFVELYNYLLRHHQPLMKYYYDFLHVTRPERAQFNIALIRKYFVELLERDKPSVVVSVHPMINAGLADAIKHSGLSGKVKLVIVVTDPNADLWRAWAEPEADLIVVPNNVAKDKLLEWGFPESKIEVLGMPIHPEFTVPPNTTKGKFLSHLGLSPNAFTVCINSGWAGGGNMLKVYRSLSEAKRPLQVIFLCGHNNSLYEQAVAAAGESIVPTAVLPFHDCMPDLMASVDLMVSKAGGLTTYQAIARRLPLAFDVLTEPMPQERGTIDLLVNEGISFALHSPEDIISIVENFEGNPDRARSSLTENLQLNLTDTAALAMGSSILRSCNPSIEVAPDFEIERSRRADSGNQTEEVAAAPLIISLRASHSK